MTTPVPPHALIRRPLHYIALWQGLTFFMLTCALWACESLGLLHEGPSNFRLMALPTAIMFLGGVIAVAHTYIQERSVLHGLIAICSYCHKIRIDDTAWTRVEQFISSHSRADFTHGVCPECFTKLTDELKQDTSGPHGNGTGDTGNMSR